MVLVRDRVRIGPELGLVAGLMDTRRAPDAQQVIRNALINAPEQGDWPWEDHCDGVASSITEHLIRAGHLPPGTRTGFEIVDTRRAP